MTTFRIAWINVCFKLVFLVWLLQAAFSGRWNVAWQHGLAIVLVSIVFPDAISVRHGEHQIDLHHLGLRHSIAVRDAAYVGYPRYGRFVICDTRHRFMKYAVLGIPPTIRRFIEQAEEAGAAAVM